MTEPSAIIRSCVHCGFCTATCPTYLLLGDELDSPRGRIVLIKEMLASDAPPAASTVTHLDRCLGCLSCVTTCPSGVDYAHLIDHAREHIEATYRRPLADRLLRAALVATLPHRARFRLASALGRLARPLAPLIGGRLGALLRAVPAEPVRGAEPAGVFAATGAQRARVALLAGCVQPALRPGIDAAAVRLLTRHGVEVVVVDAGCCGALAQHLGHTSAAAARAVIAAAEAAGPLDAVVTTTSGCGTHLKDYGTLLAGDPAWADRAAAFAAKMRDVSEVAATLDLVTVARPPLRVAYHAACSLQHGQQVRAEPRRLLTAAGFDVAEIAEGHICCGSAGTYNLLQPELAAQLRARKLDHIAATGADIVATGNIGCLNQLGGRGGARVVHLVELLDWATGGPCPAEVTASPAPENSSPDRP